MLGVARSFAEVRAYTRKHWDAMRHHALDSLPWDGAPVTDSGRQRNHFRTYDSYDLGRLPRAARSHATMGAL